MYKPKPDDAVLGDSQVPNTPYNAVVLGGIEGIKHRLRNTSLMIKLEALSNALEHNEEGLKLIYEFLQEETDHSMKWVVSNWLRQKATGATRVKLTNYISCLEHIPYELIELCLPTMDSVIAAKAFQQVGMSANETLKVLKNVYAQGAKATEQILKIMYLPIDVEQAMQNLFGGTVEQLRVAEVTRIAAEQAARIAEQAEKIASETRIVAEVEAARFAQKAKITVEVEAARVAEVARIALEEVEVARVAEVARIAALHAARVAEEARIAAEAVKKATEGTL
ncbi:pentapeptide repeat protein [Calothrix sp. NIES-4071]|nr:pentapeptide repeat protein [Calothrix sp. NIES-4071]BAZ58052.1 pentapeptide repeat protein [Calothrix sp. NIES-4105]